METSTYYPRINSSPRGAAMVLALITAVILSPLYVDRDSRHEARWSSGGLVLPAVVAGLVVAIKTTASSSSSKSGALRGTDREFGCSEINGAGFVVGIGSSWGLAGILITLLCVISWQASVQHFFWR